MLPSIDPSSLGHRRVDIELEDQVPLLDAPLLEQQEQQEEEEEEAETLSSFSPPQSRRNNVPSRPSSTLSQPKRELRISRRILVNNVWEPTWKFTKRQCSFIMYNLREIWKRKFGFCVGMLSCILVVLAVCVTVSVTDNMPIIFLRIAENQIGQYDSVLYTSGEFGTTVNYTKFDQVLSRSSKTNKDKILTSPRIEIDVYLINPVTDCDEDVISTKDIWNPSESREWFYGTTISDFANQSCPSCDVSSVCGPGFSANLIAFDTNLEKKMGLGRGWSRPKLEKGEVIVSSKIASKLGVRKGDDIIIYANSMYSNEVAFQGWFANSGLDFRRMNFSEFIWEASLYFEAYKFVFPLKVVGIESTAFNGKNSAFESDVLFLEYEHLYNHIADFISKDFLEYQDQFKSNSPYSFAKSIYVNGKDRFELYDTNDFQKVQNRVTGLIGDVMFMVGYDQFEADYPLLPVFQGLQMIGLFLGLIVDVIIAIMIGLSILLIYTLLLINVEERVFEMGVLRMVGMKLAHIFELLLMQAMMLSLPGVIFGLILGSILYFFVALVLQFLLGADVPFTITFLSIVASCFVGIAIPLVSAILPIRAAMGQRLSESLDMRRSKTKAVKVEISRMSESKISWSVVIVAGSSFLFGFFIYYFFPLALITMQFELLLMVFFAIILMSLLGLVMLCLNLERIIQLTLLKILFFWEYVAVKNMVSKNLIAHKHRNRKTTLMYGISLAFLIFISVSTGLEMKLYSFQMQRLYGTKVVMESYGFKDSETQQFIFNQLEQFMDQSEYLEDYAYKSYPLNNILDQSSYVMRPIGDYFRVGMGNVQAISPNFYEVLDPQFLIVNQQDSRYEGWCVSEQLYGADGSFGFMGDKRRKIDLGVEDIFDDNVVYEMKKNTNMFPKYTYRLMKFNSVLESGAASSFTKYQSQIPPDAFFSYPSMFKLIEGMELNDYVSLGVYGFNQQQGSKKSVEQILDIPIQYIYFKLKGGMSSTEVSELIEDLRNMLYKAEYKYYGDSWETDTYYDDDEDDEFFDDDEDEYDDFEFRAIGDNKEKRGKKYDGNKSDFLPPSSVNPNFAYTFHNVNEVIEQIKVIENVMSFFFYLSTAFTMIMCFFSLVSNMYTNVQEQAMEIGILRAMGTRKWTLNRINIYEALIIIYTAGIIGVIIGLCIGYTMVLQQQLFTQLPLPFVFPYEIVVTVLFVGMICGVISSVIPINLLLSKDIVNVMRKL